jgi:hypothetical protein
MTCGRQTPEAILIGRQTAAAAKARRRGPNDREARAAVKVALETYAIRHGAHAAGALASALAGDWFTRVDPSQSARAAACALFKPPARESAQGRAVSGGQIKQGGTP